MFCNGALRALLEREAFADRDAAAHRRSLLDLGVKDAVVISFETLVTQLNRWRILGSRATRLTRVGGLSAKQRTGRQTLENDQNPATQSLAEFVQPVCKSA